MSLRTHLTALEASDLIRLAEVQPEIEYLFKHALVQDAAYASLLKADRRLLHRAVGETLERLYPDRLDELAATLAFHFEKAEAHDKALTYLLLAGKRAVSTSANQEAIHHLSRALGLLKSLPEDPQTLRNEVVAQTLLGSTYLAVQGSAPEVEQAFKRAIALCERLGLTARLLPAQIGLCAYYLYQGEMLKALEIGEQCLSLAQHLPGPEPLVYAHEMMGACHLLLGNLAPAQAHSEQALAFYNPRKRVMISAVNDPGVTSLGCLAWILWLRGFPEQALRKSEEALALARELAQPHSLGFAIMFDAWLHQHLQDVPAILNRVSELSDLASTYGFLYGIPLSAILHGWTLVKRDQAQPGIEHILRGLKGWQDLREESWKSHLLALLAEAYGQAGQASQGLSVLAEAHATVEKTQERYYEAELHRLEGELLSAQGAAEQEVAQCHQRAIEVARRQQAKSWELRATMSLCRLLEKQGKREEARQRLAEIYGWFTEGFDTADLQKARALLASLS